MYAGQYAWISLLFVAVVLFLFRKIYGEVVEQSLLMVEQCLIKYFFKETGFRCCNINGIIPYGDRSNLSI
jgi:hypothetical protein